jgi:predicted neutral ceramidase superfamily lipid hydrolase
MDISKIKVESSAVEREWIAKTLSQFQCGIITSTKEAADEIIVEVKKRLIARLKKEIDGSNEDKRNGFLSDNDDIIMATETAIELIADAEGDDGL